MTSGGQTFTAMARPRFPRCALGLLAAALGGCGPESAELATDGAPRLRVQVAGESGPRACEANDRIDRVVVERANDVGGFTLVREDSWRACQTGLRLPELGPDPVRLRVRARGQLGVDRVLYSAEADVALGPDGQVDPEVLVLEPQVAFLRVSWVPPDGQNDVCGRGWSYEVTPDADLVNATNPILGRAACDATVGPPPSERPLVLPTGRYHIEVQVEDDAGELRYARSESRVLSPGPNTFQALLSPVGGRIGVDWRFGVADLDTRDCQTFAVDDVRIVLRNAEDPDEVLASRLVPCGARRLHFLSDESGPIRVEAGRRLDLEMYAEGQHLFRGHQEFEMPTGDEEVVVSLSPIGRGRITWTVNQEACARPTPVGYEVSLIDEETQMLAWSAALPPTETSTTTWYLPYGFYEVEVLGPRMGETPCRARARYLMEAPENDWAPLHLTLDD